MIIAAVKEGGGQFHVVFLFQVEEVRLLDRVSPRRSRVGTLYLTATHTIFVEEEAEVRSETWVGTSAGVRSLSFKLLYAFKAIFNRCVDCVRQRHDA